MSRYQDLAFLGPGHISTVKPVRRNGGDLSRYLHLQDELRDTSIAIEFDADLKVNLEIFNFETGVLLDRGRKYKAQAPEEPTLFRSDNALNSKKVLWIRDSFVNALDPLMAMTFRESLQMDYRRVTPELFARLVARYRPDIVVLTVVERNLNWGTFRKLPEPL